VVISIIALLIAILLPALQKARESAQVIKCANNVKEMGLGVLLYTEDWKRYFPINDCSGVLAGNPPLPLGVNGVSGNFSWFVYGDPNADPLEPIGRFLNAYVNLPTHVAGGLASEGYDLFNCPADTGQAQALPDIFPICLVGPHPTEGSNFEMNGNSYSYNSNCPNIGASCPVPPGTSGLTLNGTAGLWGRKYAAVTEPARTVIVSDNFWVVGAFTWDGWCDAFYRNMYHFKNGGDPIMNICFVDGHVKFTPIVIETGAGVWEDQAYTWFVP